MGVGSGSNPLIETPPESRLGLSLRTPASSRLASSPPPLSTERKRERGEGEGGEVTGSDLRCSKTACNAKTFRLQLVIPMDLGKAIEAVVLLR